MLVVFSGLPGVGKSALADAVGRELGAAVVSVDPIEAAIIRSGIAQSFETGLAAYEVGATLVEHQLRLGLTVIADAANYLEVGRAMWRGAAERTGADLRVIEVECPDLDEHRRRLESRRRGIEAFPEPSWDDVQRRRSEWEPWTDPRLTLDSTRPLEDLVAVCLTFLKDGANGNR